jgi:tight adherence protein B
MSMDAQKGLLLLFVFVCIASGVFQSTENPRGLLRRLASGYVARLDAQHRWMFLPEAGMKIASTQALIMVCALMLYGVFAAGWLLAVVAIVAVVPPVFVAQQVARRRAAIDEQANGFALALSNALRATASIGDALKGATDVTAKPLQDELSTVLRQVRIGSTIEEALLNLSARVQSNALDVVVSALLIGRQTGGDLPRILEGTAASLRELKRLEKHTDKTVRGAKQGLATSTLMTIGMAIALPRLFHGFLDPLKNTTKGQIMLSQMIVVFCLSLYLGYRFTRKSV